MKIMNKYKRVLSLVLTMVMLAGSFPAQIFAEETGTEKVCTCKEKCTRDHIDRDCPVCSALPDKDSEEWNEELEKKLHELCKGIEKEENSSIEEQPAAQAENEPAAEPMVEEEPEGAENPEGAEKNETVENPEAAEDQKTEENPEAAEDSETEEISEVNEEPGSEERSGSAEKPENGEDPEANKDHAAEKAETEENSESAGETTDEGNPGSAEEQLTEGNPKSEDGSDNGENPEPDEKYESKENPEADEKSENKENSEATEDPKSEDNPESTEEPESEEPESEEPGSEEPGSEETLNSTEKPESEGNPEPEETSENAEESEKPDPLTCAHIFAEGTCTVCGVTEENWNRYLQSICVHSFADGLCTLCGLSAEEYIAAVRSSCAHEFDEKGVCALCGMTEQEYIAEKQSSCEHSFQEGACVFCGINEEVYIAALQASCSHKFNWRGVCSLCGISKKTFTAQQNEKQGTCAHSFNEEHVCTLCGLTEEECKRELRSSCTHSFGENGVCTLCGMTREEYKKQLQEQCEHSFGDDSVCTLCGISEEVYLQQFRGQCEHSFGEDNICTLCGMTREEYKKQLQEQCGHSFGEDNSCTLCGMTREEYKKQLQAECEHVFSEDDICALCGITKEEYKIQEQERCEHLFRGGMCELCGLAELSYRKLLQERCEHSFENGVCLLCGLSEEKYQKQLWEQCEHEFDENGACTLCSITAEQYALLLQEHCAHEFGEDGICILCGITEEDYIQSLCFSQSVQVGDMIVTVEAGPGVLPVGAELYCGLVTDVEEAAALDSAVEDLRTDGRKVNASYKFDIKIFSDGVEIQPDASKGKVNVTFRMADHLNESAYVDVYHVSVSGEVNSETEEGALQAQELNPVVGSGSGEADAEAGAEIRVATGGFSWYVVEFSYNDKTYVMSGSTVVRLQEVLNALEIPLGEISDVSVSNEELLLAAYMTDEMSGGGEWMLLSLQPFDTEEELRLSVDGVPYRIKVTDANSSKNFCVVSAGSETEYSLGTDSTDTTVYTFSAAHSEYVFGSAGMGAHKSGLAVKEGKTVVLYIPKGVTVSSYGGNAVKQQGAGAGIRVPSSSTLIVVGGGTLWVYGGAPAAGEAGERGYNGYTYTWKTKSCNQPISHMWEGGGQGGKGGYGGGGGGAGIGTDGGDGGDGGEGGSFDPSLINDSKLKTSSIECDSKIIKCSGDELIWEGSFGTAGKDGKSGSSAMDCGKLWTYHFYINIKVGENGGAGAIGKAGERSTSKSAIESSNLVLFAGGGGPGGGGQGGFHGAYIGKGGSGGGGGGGGSGGTTAWSRSGADLNPTGGGGGSGDGKVVKPGYKALVGGSLGGNSGAQTGGSGPDYGENPDENPETKSVADAVRLHIRLVVTAENDASVSEENTVDTYYDGRDYPNLPGEYIPAVSAGQAFYGYYTEMQGKGTQIYDGDGTWTGEKIVPLTGSDTITLYGYKQAAVADIGKTHYKTLQAAIDAAKSGETVTLRCDIALDSPVTVSGNVTLDLKGHKLSAAENKCAGSGLINVNSSGYLCIDSSAGQGTVENNGGGNRYAVTVNGGALIIMGDVKLLGISTEICEGIGVLGTGGSLRLKTNTAYVQGYGMKIGAGISTNGMSLDLPGGAVYGGSQDGIATGIRITGGNLSYSGYGADVGGVPYGTQPCSSMSMFYVTGGTLSVTGGACTGKTYGIINNGGTVNVSGGTVSGNGETAGGSGTGSGFGVYQRSGGLYISGGTVKGTKNGIYLEAAGNFEVTGKPSVIGSAGNDAICIKAGYTPDRSKCMVKGGYFTSDISNSNLVPVGFLCLDVDSPREDLCTHRVLPESTGDIVEPLYKTYDALPAVGYRIIAGFDANITRTEYFAGDDTTLSRPLTSAPVDVGTYQVRVTGSCESSAFQKTVKFDIEKRTVHITVKSQTSTFGETPAELSWSIAEGDIVSGHQASVNIRYSASGTEEAETPTDAGVYKYYISDFSVNEKEGSGGDVNGNYTAVLSDDTGVYTILPIQLALKNEPKLAENLQYSGSAQGLITAAGEANHIKGTVKYAVTEDPAADPETLTYTDTYLSLMAVDAGTYYVYCKVTGEGSNYTDTASVRIGSVTVAKVKTAWGVNIQPDPLDAKVDKYDPQKAKIQSLYKLTSSMKKDTAGFAKVTYTVTAQSTGIKEEYTEEAPDFKMYNLKKAYPDTYTVRIEATADQNHYIEGNETGVVVLTGEVVINKIAVPSARMSTFTVGSAVYGSALSAFALTRTTEGKVPGTAQWKEGDKTVVSPGKYACLYVPDEAVGHIYNTTEFTLELTANQFIPAPVTISWTGELFSYDKKPHAPKVTVNGLIGEDSCSVKVHFYQDGTELESAPAEQGYYTAKVLTDADLGNSFYTLDGKTYSTEFLITGYTPEIIYAEDVYGAYDGITAYGITVLNVPSNEGTKIEYSADNGANWSEINPEFKDKGDYKVAYKVTIPALGGQSDPTVVQGEAAVHIYEGSAPAYITEPQVREDFTFDGDSHCLLDQSVVPEAKNGVIRYASVEISEYTGNVDDLTFTDKKPEATDAGNYLVYWRLETEEGEPRSNPGVGIVTVFPKTVKLFWSGEGFTEKEGKLTVPYDGSEKLPKAAASEALCAGDTLSVTGTGTDAGTYTAVATVVNASGKDTGKNYNLVNGSCEYVIERIPVAVEKAPYVPTQIVVIEDDTEETEYDLINAGTVDGGSIEYFAEDETTGSLTVPQRSAAGVYPVSYQIVADRNHYCLVSGEPAERSEKIDLGESILYARATAVAPVALEPEYSGEPQPLITAGTGTVQPAGAEMQYTLKEDPEESDWCASPENITATEPGTYTVYYRAKADKIEGYYVTSLTGEIRASIRKKQISLTQKDFDTVTAVTKEYNGNVRISAQIELSVPYEGCQLNITGTCQNEHVNTDPAENPVTVKAVYFTAKEDTARYVLNLPETEHITVPGIVKPRTARLRWSGTVLDYNGEPQAPSATVINPVSGDSCTVTVSGKEVNANAESGVLCPGKQIYTASAESLDNPDYTLTDCESLTSEYMINKIEPYGTEPELITGLVYNGASQELVTAGSSKDGTYHYAVVRYDPAYEPGTAELKEEIPAVKDAGDYMLEWQIIGDGNHLNGERTTGMKVTVEKAVAAASKEPAAREGLVYNGNSQELVSAGESADGTLYYHAGGTTAPDTEDTGAWSANLPTAVSAGDYTIWWYIRSSDSGNIQDSVPRMLTVSVSRKAAFLVWTNTELTYTGGSLLPDAQIYNICEGDDLSAAITCGEEHVNVGTYTALASPAGEDRENYTFGDRAETIFRIRPAAPQITLLPAAKTDLVYNGTYQEIMRAGLCAGGTLYYSTDGHNWQNFVLHGKDAGRYPVYWYIKGDRNHTDSAVSVLDTYAVISPKTAELIWTEEEYTYTGLSCCPSASVANLEEGDSCSVTVTGAQTDAGEDYTATADSLDNPNYTLPENPQKRFTIAKAEPQYIPPDGPASHVYTGNPIYFITTPGSSAHGTFEYNMTGEDGSWSASVDGITGTDAGDYTIYCRFNGDRNHISYPAETAVVSINKAAAQVTEVPKAAKQVYSGEEQSLLAAPGKCDTETGTILYRLGENGSWSGSIPEAKNAGTYTVYYKAAEDRNHTESAEGSLQVTIGRASPETGDPVASSVTYGEDIVKKSVLSGYAEGGTMQWQEESFVPDHTGTVNCTAVFLPYDSENYLSVEVQVPVEVKPKTVELSWKELSFEYDGDPHVPVAEAEGLVGTDVCTVKVQGSSEVLPGEYRAEAVSLSNSNYILPEDTAVSYIITPKEMTDAYANDVHVKYDGAYHSITIKNLPANAKAEYSTDGGSTWSGENPAYREISATYYTVNYRITCTGYKTKTGSATITIEENPIIEKAPQVFTDLVYNGTAQQVAQPMTFYDPESSTALYCVWRQGQTGAASYTEEIPAAVQAGNYTLHYIALRGPEDAPESVSGQVTFQISRRSTEAEWNNLSFVYDGTEKCPSVSLTNIVPGDEETIAPVVSGAAKNAGTYIAELTSVGNDNYALPENRKVTFTITKAEASFNAPVPVENAVADGGPVEILTAGSTTDGTMLYSSTLTDDSWVSTVPKAVKPGIYTVYYKVKGDENHNDSGVYSVTAKLYAGTASAKTAPAACRHVYNGSAQFLCTAGTTEEGTILYSTDGSVWTEELPAGTNAGTYSVYWKITGDELHFDSLPVSFTAEIVKADSRVTAAPGAVRNLVYNTELQALVTAGTAEGGTLTYSCRETGASEHAEIPEGRDAGTYTVSWYVKGDDNHNDSASASLTVNIAKAVYADKGTIRAESVVYGETLSESRFTGVLGGTLTWKNPEFAPAAGTVSCQALFRPTDSKNYLEETLTVPVTVEKKSVTVIWDESTLSFEYDGKVHSPSAKAGGLVGKDYCPLTVTGSATEVGTYTAEVTAVGNANYTLPAAGLECTYMITPATMPVSASDLVFSFSETDKTQYSITLKGVPEGAEVYYSTDNKEYTEVNPVFTPDMGKAGTDVNYQVWYYVMHPDYFDAYGSAKVMIAGGKIAEAEKAPQAKEHLQYNGSDQALVIAGSVDQAKYPGAELQYMLTQANAVNSVSNGGFSAEIPQAREAGEYVVLYRIKGDGGDIHDSEVFTIPVTVSPRPLPLKWQRSVSDSTGTSFVYSYDGKTHIPCATAEGLEGEMFTAEIVCDSGTPLEPGNYTARAVSLVDGSGAEDTNYCVDPASSAQEFEIRKETAKASKLPAAVSGLVYNGNEQLLCTSGHSDEGVFLYSLTGLDGSYSKELPGQTGAGEYKVYYYIKGDIYHNDSAVSTLSCGITKAASAVLVKPAAVKGLVYTAKPQTLVEAGQAYGGTLLYGVNGGTFGKQLPTGLNAGNYTVSCYVLGDANHLDSGTVSVTAEIGQAVCPLTAPEKISGLVYSAAPQILVSAGSSMRGRVKYSTDNGGTWTDKVEKVTGTNAGTYTVLYYAESTDPNYRDGETGSLEVIIGKAEPKDIGDPLASAITYGEKLGQSKITGMTGGRAEWTDPDRVPSAGTTKYAAVYTPDDLNNYTVKKFEIYVSVSARTAELAWGTEKMEYTGEPLVRTAKVANLLGADECTVSVSGEQTVPGRYTATAAGLSNTNYALPENRTAGFEIVAIEMKNLIAYDVKGAEKEGKTYSIQVQNAPKGSVITYSTDGVNYSAENPAFSEAGEYKVYYKVTCTGYIDGSGSAKITIEFGAVEFEITAPKAKTLTYNGKNQILIEAGKAEAVRAGERYEAVMQYAVVTNASELDNLTMTPDLPERKEAGTCYVIYCAWDPVTNTYSSADFVTVEIAARTLKLEWSGLVWKYDGENHKPSVWGTNICDGDSCTLTVYGGAKEIGSHTAEAKDVSNPNYALPADATVKFTIEKAEPHVTAPVPVESLVYNGEKRNLLTGGETSDGTLLYSPDGKNYTEQIPSAAESGTYAVYWYVKGDRYHKDSEVSVLSCSIAKAASAVIVKPAAMEGLVYTANTQTLIEAGQAYGGTLLYSVNGGTFGTELPAGTNAGSYTVSCYVQGDRNHLDSETADVTVTIDQAVCGITAPQKITGLVYSAAPQTLISAGTSEHGMVKYSTDNGGTWTDQVEKVTGTNAGTYTVLYYAESTDPNYRDGETGSLEVIIGKAEPEDIGEPLASAITYGEKLGQSNITGVTGGRAEWTDPDRVPSAGTEIFAAVYTPDDLNNYTSKKLGISVSVNAREAVLTWGTEKMEYTGELLARTAEVANLLGADECTVSVSGEQTVPGTYTATAAGLSNPNYVLPENRTAGFEIVAIEMKNLIAYDVKGAEKEGKTYSIQVQNAPKGSVITYSTDGVNYSAENPAFSKEGEYKVYYKVTCTGYIDGSGSAKITIEYGAVEFEITAPKAKTLTYNGKNQTLIEAGKAEAVRTGERYEAVMQYAVVTNASELDNLTMTPDLPERKEAGTYYVLYRAWDPVTDTYSSLDFVFVEIAARVLELEWSGLVWKYDGENHKLSVIGTNICDGDSCTVTVYGNAKEIGPHTAEAKEVSNSNYALPEDTALEFTIEKAELHVTAPVPVENLVYNGEKRNLLTGGETSDGTLLYSMDGKNYTEQIPSAAESGTYAVYWYVKGDRYHNDSEVSTLSCSIAKAAAVISVMPAAVEGLVYTANPQTLIEAGQAYGGTLLYSVNNGAFGTELPAGTNAGSYTVSCYVQGDRNHLDSETAEVTAKIDQAVCVVDAPKKLTGLVYSAAPQVLISAGTSEHGTVKYSTDGGHNWTDRADEVTGINAGKYTVLYYAESADPNYRNSENGSTDVKIEKAEPENIGNPVASGIVYGDTLSHSKITGVTGGTVLWTEPYRTPVTGTENFEAVYTPEDTVNYVDKKLEIPVTVAARVAELAWGPERLEYTGGPVARTAMVANLLGDDECTVMVSGEQTLPGVYTATAVELSNSNYTLPANPTASFEIKGTAPMSNLTAFDVIGVEKAGKSYSIEVLNAPEEAVITYSTDGVHYSAANPSFSAAGEYRVYYSVTCVGYRDHSGSAEVLIGQPGSTEFELTAPAAKNLTYNGKNQVTVEQGKAEVIRDGERYEAVMLYALVTELNDPESVPMTKNLPQRKEAGNCFVLYRAWDPVTDTYSSVSVVNIVIAAKELELEWSDLTWQYDGENHKPTATGTNICEGDSCTVTVYGAAKEIGTHIAEAKEVSNPNYVLPEDATEKFIIEKADPRVTAPVPVEDLVYNGEKQVLLTTGETLDGTLYYSLDGEKFTEQIPSATESGTYTVYWYVKGDHDHRDTEVQTLRVKIAKASQGGGSTSGGNWQHGATGTLRFTCSQPYEDFLSFEIDGKEVDRSLYAVTKGSTVVDVSKDYMNTLAAGAHSYRFNYRNYESMSGSFTVTAKVTPQSGGTGSGVKTGDDADGTWFIAGGTSLTILCLTVSVLLRNQGQRRKKEEN